MDDAVPTFWKQTLSRALHRCGLDLRRHPVTPPPDWSEQAFHRVLPSSATQVQSPLTPAEEFTLYCIRHAEESRSQLFQDLFVRWQLKDKRNGFFVDFGATDGVELSNTFYLEKNLGWSGILAEPARCWHEQLAKNRSSVIDKRCIWKESGDILSFNEALTYPELSTIEDFSQGDNHAQGRTSVTTYDVPTISLNDLLTEHNAPAQMDYLSIDTEGSELAILSNLDYQRFRFNIITVEHNHTPEQQRIHELLSRHGYQRTFTQLSGFDDWYVHTGH